MKTDDIISKLKECTEEEIISFATDFFTDAIKKQIPMKANGITCPNCGGYGSRSEEHSYKHDYCCECGQKLEWD